MTSTNVVKIARSGRILVDENQRGTPQRRSATRNYLAYGAIQTQVSEITIDQLLCQYDEQLKMRA